VSRLATSFVLGYHGCDREIGLRAINGEIALIQSHQSYDWLGPGAYFWESDPRRALEWAQEKAKRNRDFDPFVIGAVIDLRHCLDLLSREDLEILRAAYHSLQSLHERMKLPMPENVGVKGRPAADRPLRYLDCEVVNHLHALMEQQQGDGATPPYDSARGLFTEGEALFPGSGFMSRTHVQIAIRNMDCIKGLFLPRPYPSL
jgi:hypothetical protein